MGILKTRGKNNRLILLYIKVLKVKPVYQQTTLFPKLDVEEISTLWHFSTNVNKGSFFPQSIPGIEIPSPIL